MTDKFIDRTLALLERRIAWPHYPVLNMVRGDQRGRIEASDLLVIHLHVGGSKRFQSFDSMIEQGWRASD